MASNGSATNLRRHLFVKHDIAAAAYNSQLAQIKQKRAIPNDNSTPIPKTRQQQLNKALIDCIIDDSLPFTTFMKLGMVNLIKTFDSRYDPSSWFTITSRVVDIYHDYVDQVKVSWRLVKEEYYM